MLSCRSYALFTKSSHEPGAGLPDDREALGRIAQDVSFFNAREYLGLDVATGFSPSSPGLKLAAHQHDRSRSVPGDR